VSRNNFVKNTPTSPAAKFQAAAVYKPPTSRD